MDAKVWRMTRIRQKMKGKRCEQGRGNSLCKCPRGSMCLLKAASSSGHCSKGVSNGEKAHCLRGRSRRRTEVGK